MDSAQPRPAPAGVPVDDNKRMMLFTGRGNPALGAAIADELGMELGAVTLKTFSAGESYCRLDESVRGADVFIVQSTCDNRETDVRTNHALMELLLLIDAAVGASAHRVIAVMPWFGYSRQDKKSELREPISARLVAHMLETAGVDRVLAVDLHAGQIQGFFTKPLDHATAMHLIAEYFLGLQLDDLVVVAPDVGRVKLNNKFADKLGADLALMTKERPAQQVAEIGYVIGDVRGKTALIIDDIIDTGGTLAAAGETVLGAGAKCVYAAATHGLFSGDANRILADGPFEQIVVTDTVPLREGAPDNVVVLSLAPLLAESIKNIFTNRPISDVFHGQNQPF
jgi:ribose-phosphate pyrophosphokinase